jgi:hypothetical protein
MSYDHLKERYKAQILYHVNKMSSHLYRQVRVFNAIEFASLKILNTNMFATYSFVLNMIFSSMLLYQFLNFVYINKDPVLFTYGRFLTTLSRL